jgi:hypothetical protein
MINAPKSVIHQNIVTLREAVHVNRDFLPPTWSDADCLRLYSLRTVIERKFSHNTQIYHVKELNVRGIDQVAKHRMIVLVLDLLKDLACLKLGRLDLLGHISHFLPFAADRVPQNI